MAKTTRARTKKSQNPRQNKPAAALGVRSRAPGGKRNTSKELQSPEATPTPRMALVELIPTNRQELIAVAAYYKAEQRNFRPGGEVGDWLEAEKEIDRLSRLT